MTVRTEIARQVNVIEESGREPINIHIDYDSLYELCQDIGASLPEKGAIHNMMYDGYQVTVSLKENEIKVS